MDTTYNFPQIFKQMNKLTLIQAFLYNTYCW